MMCCLCGRSMRTAAVFIGTLAVGPVCARRAGLVEAARKKAGTLRLGPRYVSKARSDGQHTLDLFPEVVHG